MSEEIDWSDDDEAAADRGLQRRIARLGGRLPSQLTPEERAALGRSPAAAPTPPTPPVMPAPGLVTDAQQAFITDLLAADDAAHRQTLLTARGDELKAELDRRTQLRGQLLAAAPTSDEQTWPDWVVQLAATYAMSPPPRG